MIKNIICLLILTLTFTLPHKVFADNPLKNACIKDAEADFKQAESDAKFELRASKAACRFTPEVASCVVGCFPAFKTCLQPVFESLKTCRKACFDTLLDARQNARETIGCGQTCNTNGDFQKAIIEANLAFNSCRITCRSSDESINARAGCRTAHGLCVNDCKNAN